MGSLQLKLFGQEVELNLHFRTGFRAEHGRWAHVKAGVVGNVSDCTLRLACHFSLAVCLILSLCADLIYDCTGEIVFQILNAKRGVIVKPSRVLLLVIRVESEVVRLHLASWAREEGRNRYSALL